MCRLPELFAINMTQPEYNDMSAVFRASLDRGVQILRLPGNGVAAARAEGRAFRGQVYCQGDALRSDAC